MSPTLVCSITYDRRTNPLPSFQVAGRIQAVPILSAQSNYKVGQAAAPPSPSSGGGIPEQHRVAWGQEVNQHIDSRQI
ncbi:hypothetical protein E2C01_080148 [Portunus trituberculatus]|uniref:Uncharacterized protein n=1 Tax=Portunus trituberculatus TaxID=210409 RepID=A0A5B7IV86_PORTR|nr:hypothetical protein [Portunus trituberculatus]